ncbi:MAG: MazG family protein, partial [Ardenticatenaceae bacterium]
MPQITILGLGPGEWKHLTLEALAALNSHDEVWLRTRYHPLIEEMPAHLAVHSFDAFYEEAEEFAALYRRIAEEVIRLGRREEGILYAVPGHPWVGESTVFQIVGLAREKGIPVRVVDGLSFVEPVLAAVERDALDGLQIADASEVARRYAPPFDADRPVIVGQLYSRMVASDVKLVLMELYPAEHPVTILYGAGTREGRTITMPLYRLDQQSDFSYLTTLWVPPLPWPSSLPSFQNIVAHLRSPDGCPWDREQDHDTLRPFVLEEAYEVAEAIDNDSAPDLCDELGDLLLMILMNAQIASESGDFNMSDVIASISEKMIRRHPHVFGSTTVSGSADVLRNWEAIKAEERNAT